MKTNMQFNLLYTVQFCCYLINVLLAIPYVPFKNALVITSYDIILKILKILAHEAVKQTNSVGRKVLGG